MLAIEKNPVVSVYHDYNDGKPVFSGTGLDVAFIMLYLYFNGTDVTLFDYPSLSPQMIDTLIKSMDYDSLSYLLERIHWRLSLNKFGPHKIDINKFIYLFGEYLSDEDQVMFKLEHG